jgi:Zn-dependent protease
LFITTLFENPELFLMQFLVVVFSVCCHEYFHARVALWQGDSTAANAGHLTLNPLKQMGMMSLIIFVFTGLAWGAVPVNPSRMKHKYSDALVSFAGPGANLLLFFLFCCGIAAVFAFGGIENVNGTVNYGVHAKTAKTLFSLGAAINVVLFVINMLPVPTLDGWNVYAYFFPKLTLHNSEIGYGAMLFVFLLVLVSINKIFEAAFYLTSFVVNNLLFLLSCVGLY